MTFDRQAARARLEEDIDTLFDYATQYPGSDIQTNRCLAAHERVRFQDLPAALTELDRMEAQCVRWEAMYEGMMAERDGYWADRDRLEAAIQAKCRACYAVADYCPIPEWCALYEWRPQ